MNLPQRLVIIGGGEHARVVAEAANSRAGVWQVDAVVDPKRVSWAAHGQTLRCLGSDEAAVAALQGAAVVLGIGSLGSTSLRRNLSNFYDRAGARWAIVAHSTAWISPSARIEPGAVLMAGAVINAGAWVGGHAVINTGAIIEHDVRVGPFAFVGPGAIVGGGSVIGADAYLGLGCRVRDHVQIGEAVTVAMGAVVINSVPAHSRVLGVPARAAPTTRS